MTDQQKLVEIAGIINSALYLTGVALLGVYTSHLPASYLAVATFGICYFSYLAQAMAPGSITAIGVTVLSILTGLAAGIMVLT